MVIKRDGRLVSFDKDKIRQAIISAFIEVDGEETAYAKDKSNEIARYIYTSFYGRDATVEEIQKMVEDKLMASNRKDVARSYIIYRNNRDRIRQEKSQLMRDVANKLKASNVQNQNANVDEESFGGRMGEANEAVTKDYALYHIVSAIARKNHLMNIAYIHDLGQYAVGSHNCLSVPFDDLLAKGFNTKQTDVRPANSLSTALQLIAVIFQLQSLQQFGGVSATHLDWTLVPYVRKSFYKHFSNGMKYIYNIDYVDSFDSERSITDNYYTKDCWSSAYKYAMDMTVKECQQAVEGMYHNLNTLQSRSGNQLPFTSINYGTCTLPEGRMVIKALIEGSIKGVGKHHKTSIFPCGIFQCMKGVNRKPGDPNYDLFQLALKSTSQRLYPNYANVDWSGNAGYDINDPKTYFSTMGCRTANAWDANGFGQLKDGRGNICPSTIIMPTIAMMAKDESEKKNKDIVEVFMKLLDKVIHETKNSLIERYQYICSQSPNAAKFMYENNVMAGYIPEEGIRSALKHGTLAVG